LQIPKKEFRLIVYQKFHIEKESFILMNQEFTSAKEARLTFLFCKLEKMKSIDMTNRNYFFNKFFSSSFTGGFSNENYRKAVLINMFSYLGIFILFSFLIIGIIKDRIIYSGILLLFIAISISNLIYIKQES